MFRNAVCFLLLLAVISVSGESLLREPSTTENNGSQSHECPANQEWTSCGTACPLSCSTPPRQACTLQCIIGCQCKSGYVLNSRGDCVQPNECP